MDFSIPDEPDTDALWDSAGNEWQRKVDTKKVWKCVETESVRSWVGLLRDFGPLTDTPPVPKVGDILTEKTAFRLVARAYPLGMRCKGVLGMSQFGWCESDGVRDINFWIVGVLFYTQNFKGK